MRSTPRPYISYATYFLIKTIYHFLSQWILRNGRRILMNQWASFLFYTLPLNHQLIKPNLKAWVTCISVISHALSRLRFPSKNRVSFYGRENYYIRILQSITLTYHPRARLVDQVLLLIALEAIKNLVLQLNLKFQLILTPLTYSVGNAMMN